MPFNHFRKVLNDGCGFASVEGDNRRAFTDQLKRMRCVLIAKVVRFVKLP
jgi:hypothetical protein